MKSIKSLIRKRKILIVFFYFISFVHFYAQEIEYKRIHGKVTHLGAPLPNVNIVIDNTTSGTKTDTNGRYNIKVKVGQSLIYSYVGFKTVRIIVEDVTTVLNIEMIEKVNELDEATVTARKTKSAVLERFEKKNKKFKTAMGVVDPKSSGFSINYIDGEEIKPHYLSLSEAILGKVPGAVLDPITKKFIIKPTMSINNAPPPLWDVDGVIFQEEPSVNLNEIRDIHIIKTTNRYGTLGAGGVIIVRTKYGSFDDVEEKRKTITQQYTNKNTYNQDALSISENDISVNEYTNTLKEINNAEKAFIYYNETLKPQLKLLKTHLSIAQNFVQIYNATDKAKEIYKEQIINNHHHPERLKAIAYHLQDLGFKKEAIEVYQSIYKLRPKYAQSYRDLANAYKDNDQYKKAWRLYMSYLLQGHDVSNDGIGQILYNEMEYLYFNRNNQSAITQKFVPKNENIQEFRNDARLVIEWNTSEAEFDIEFVNPAQQSYVFEHSLEANQKLIVSEKEKGYSSKEFSVDTIGEGNWLVNMTYKGNKKPEPTYFKVTTYYNWGKSNQRQEIKVYNFQNQREKIQLIILNKSKLVSLN